MDWFWVYRLVVRQAYTLHSIPLAMGPTGTGTAITGLLTVFLPWLYLGPM